jgi:hypothetical protein
MRIAAAAVFAGLLGAPVLADEAEIRALVESLAGTEVLVDVDDWVPFASNETDHRLLHTLKDRDLITFGMNQNGVFPVRLAAPLEPPTTFPPPRKIRFSLGVPEEVLVVQVQPVISGECDWLVRSRVFFADEMNGATVIALAVTDTTGISYRDGITLLHCFRLTREGLQQTSATLADPAARR